jgi:hypothetical protein
LCRKTLRKLEDARKRHERATEGALDRDCGFAAEYVECWRRLFEMEDA